MYIYINTLRMVNLSSSRADLKKKQSAKVEMFKAKVYILSCTSNKYRS